MPERPTLTGTFTLVEQDERWVKLLNWMLTARREAAMDERYGPCWRCEGMGV